MVKAVEQVQQPRGFARIDFAVLERLGDLCRQTANQSEHLTKIGGQQEWMSAVVGRYTTTGGPLQPQRHDGQG